MSQPPHPDSCVCLNCGTPWDQAHLICPNCGAPWASSAGSASCLRAGIKVLVTVGLVLFSLSAGACGACFVFFNLGDAAGAGPYYYPSRAAGGFGLALLVLSAITGWAIFWLHRRRRQ